MPEDGASPSGGWEEVYGAMGVSTSAEDDAPPCPDCGEACPRVRVDRYWCPEHGTFAATG
jgi:hypothetical protein